ncbi:MAG: GAF domain-containing protein [Synergistaceae bacterium]|nr:GAF domain-containing protein [Synergistaceae bacterium]
MPMPKVEKFLDVGIALSSEKNVDKLLEKILVAAMDISECDSGMLHIVDDGADGGTLRLKIAIAKSLGGIRRIVGDDEDDLPSIPLSRNSISACAVMDKTPINIADVYAEEHRGFTVPKDIYAKIGYKIISTLVVPMENDYGEVIGVLQLANAQDAEGKIIPFAPMYERVISSLASQAAICMTSRKHAEEVTELLDSFVRVMSAAIDARSPYNANHARNMVEYARKFLAWLNASGLAEFDEFRERQFLMSVWLHDIGKMVVPMAVMDKDSRLGAKISEVTHRFQVIGLQNEIDFLNGSIDEIERDRRAAELIAAGELVEKADRAGFLTDETLAAIRALGEAKARAPEGDVPYLSDDELNCLLVQKGTLTDDERRIMENHVTMTRRMLDEMSFPKRYSSIPGWASMHHEYLDGSGYPDKLTGEAIPAEVRILTILDIYDALTARDRPYKPAIPPEKVFAILDGMAAAGQIDAKFLDLFRQSEAWKE